MKDVQVKGFWFPAGARDIDYRESLCRTKSLQWVLRNWSRKRTVVQAGGSYGVWPAICAKHFDLVYSFEPDWVSFYYLNRNCPFENVIKIQAALGQVNKTVALQRKSFTGHRVNDLGYIPGITIDTLRLFSCDAILLDVEGYEYYALKGAKATIREFRPLVLFEYRPETMKYHQIDPELCTKFLEKEGYVQVANIGADKIYTPREAVDE